jgi:membrane-associated phospholipid phosphatase
VRHESRQSAGPGRPREPLDRLSLGFGLAYAALIGMASGRLTTGLELFLVNLAVAVTALLLLPRLRAGPWPVRLLGVVLPLLVFYLYYLETRLAQGGGIVWREAVVARVELPWWRAMSEAPQPRLLGEVLAFGYVAYVPMLVVVVLALLADPARGALAPAETVVRRICLAWALCFVVFVLVPVRSPRFLFPGLQAARFGGGPFSALARINQAYGMLYGGSFPSAHVAATAVAVWSTWRWRRALLWAVLPVAVALTVGCVYLAYHYVVDVAVGILFGGLAIVLDYVVVAAHPRLAAWRRAATGPDPSGTSPEPRRPADATGGRVP